MQGFKNASLQPMMEKLVEWSPKRIEEYSAVYESMVREIAESYHIIRVDGSFTMPKGVPYANVGSKTVIISDADIHNVERISYQFPFEGDGRISFIIYLQDPESLPEEDRDELKMLFHQFYQVLRTLILRTSFQRLITSDGDTGIPNLKAFFQFASRLMIEEKLQNYTAMNFNIHNFKMTQQFLTYLEGNQVMADYCHTVAEAVTKKEIVARLGGDNFVAIILDDNVDYFLGLIQNMVIRYKKKDKEYTFQFGATVGAAKLGGEKDIGEIMMHISTAYQSARENRVMLKYYDRQTSQELIEQKTILARFRQAIRSQEFFVVYQPKVDTKNRTLRGAEALVRWRSDSEVISPGKFIPVLEKDGCITVLDFYVLETTCRFLKRLLAEGIEPVKISVNFSKRHLANNKLVEEILDVIDRYGVPHELIEIELTESENFYNNNVMKGIVNELKQHGIQTSIDDFGTGYSSLSMLNTLRADVLKLDRSFIAQDYQADGGRGLIMLRGIVGLAKNLGHTIVAEGVETLMQLQIVNDMDCDLVQGYIFDRPLPEGEFIGRLKQKVYRLVGGLPI